MTKPYTIPTQGKHEELVEEIYKKMADFFGGLVVYPEIRVPMGERLAFTRQLISLILSAFRDGLEIPGEVGRCSRIGSPPSPEFEDWIDHVLTFHKTDLLIALTGTGKEEE